MTNILIKKYFPITVFTVIAFFIAPSFALAGFGVSPPLISEDNLVRGSHFEKTIYLVQGNPEEDLNVEIEVDSPDIADWISFQDGNSFTIPAGIQQFPFNVTIDVPPDAEFGIYKAFIRINTKPKLAEGSGQVSIALGGRVDIELTIGDNIIHEYIVKTIKILDIEEGENPKISVDVKNTGNVNTRPGSASFELFNKYGNIRLAYAENDTFEEIKSFSEGSSELEFPIDLRLAPGEYWAHVKIYDDKGSVKKELKTVFNVTKKSFVKKYVVPGILVLFAIGIFVGFRRSLFKLLKK